MPTIKWEGDASSVEKATQKMREKMKEYKEEVEKTAKSSQAFERAAVRIKEAISPTEAVKNKMKQLGDMVNRNKLSIEQSGAALSQYTDKLSKGTEAGKKRFKEQAQAAQEAAQRLAELNAQGARIKQSLETPVESYRRKLLELGKTYRAGTIDQETFVRGARRLKGELQATGQGIDKSFGATALAGLKSYALGMVSIGGAASLIRSEIEEIVRLNERISSSKMTAAEAEGALRETIFSDPKRDLIISEADRIAQDRSLPVAHVYNAMNQAYGAGGDADLAIKMVNEASQQTRNPERMVEIAAGIGDVIASSSIKSEEEAAGYLALAQATSRVKGEKVPSGLGKVVAAFKSPLAGGSEAAAAATFSALSVAGVDPDGDRMRTAAIQLVSKSRDFFDANGKKYGFNKDQHDTIDERLALLLSGDNRAMAEDFVRNVKFHSVAEGAISSLFLKPETKAIYDKSMAINSNAEQRIAKARDRKSYITGGELQGAAMSEAVVGSAAESFGLSTAFQYSEKAREDFLTLLSQSSNSSMFMTRAGLAINTGRILSRPEAISEAGIAVRDAESRLSSGGVLSESQESAVAQLKRVVDKLTAIDSEISELNGKRRSRGATRQTGRPVRP